MKVNATATLKDLGRVKGEILSAVRQVLGQLAALAAEHARSTSKFNDRTGSLRGSIRRGQRNPLHHFVAVGGGRVKHAIFIEAGTKPHEIRARRAKFLRFEQGGQVRFAKRVFHPGTKPTRFVESARNVANAVAEQYMHIGLNSAITK